MPSLRHPILYRFFETYRHNPALASLQQQLEQKTALQPAANIAETIDIYYAAIAILDKKIWSVDMDEARTEQYQLLFQELEDLLALQGHDSRHKFIIVIPIADRPRHLQSCLQSLLTLCHAFRYGGHSGQYFNKVSVIIADDSKVQANIQKHQEIARDFNSKGLETLYFGLAEQQQQLAKLNNSERSQLQKIIGDFDSSSFYHKGASITRNITYLKLNELKNKTENLLFYFVDSDQEFRIKVRCGEEDKELYAINYFYQLDRIFSRHDINILTGKVIGDPPVSPAVMAGTFLDDVIDFLQCMAATKPEQPCQFHGQAQAADNDAAYHDMADLFGFQAVTDAYPYPCSLEGAHNQANCFIDFASKLNQFFHGEHPTRKSYFNDAVPVAELTPARTIYTGNYIFNSKGLNYFIPFARLKLRMAGPVLGRIIRAECQQQFVSANLPMLHKRTVEEMGVSEFRPGVNFKHKTIDLSGEFERQFFGDIMLFTLEKLTARGYPVEAVSQAIIMEALQTTAEDMQQRYAAKQQEILQKLERLKSLFDDRNNWWNTIPGMEAALANFTDFINSLEHNFGPTSHCYAIMNSETNRNQRFNQMLEAISNYPSDRQAWQNILATSSNPGMTT